ncbi:hypothetical protein AVEN_139132-1 [Araneus ventricosus]|uniref:Uncharacterized protein n=1 Tax=Araneus ventricosus TaxID=182803 RepID=A0A4Y2K8Y6_ARAVE|nr:hypothetical protein AVEN_139132-1 [Araneus ventricosus]
MAGISLDMFLDYQIQTPSNFGLNMSEVLPINLSVNSINEIRYFVLIPKLKNRHAWGLLHVKLYVVAKCPPVGAVRKFGEGMPAQMSSSSSDRCLRFRGPSQNIPRVASKRDVNITRLD